MILLSSSRNVLYTYSNQMHENCYKNELPKLGRWERILSLSEGKINSVLQKLEERIHGRCYNPVHPYTHTQHSPNLFLCPFVSFANTDLFCKYSIASSIFFHSVQTKFLFSGQFNSFLFGAFLSFFSSITLLAFLRQCISQ